MLSINDYNHIKLLYEQLEKLNFRIKELITSEDWDSINFALQDKNTLINKIVRFESSRLAEIKENTLLNEARTKLYELEKQNLELVKKIRSDALAEIKNVKKAKKVLNTYEPITAEAKSTIEIISED